MATNTLERGSPEPNPARTARVGRVIEYQQYIDSQLGKTRRRVKWVDLWTSLAVLSAGVIAYLMLSAVIDHWIIAGGLGTVGRWLLLIGLLVGVAFHFVGVMVPFLLRKVSPVYAAAAIEHSGGTMKNTLINFLLLRKETALPDGVLDAMKEQAAVRLSTVPSDAQVDRTSLLRWCYVLAAVMVGALLYAMAAPKDSFRSIHRVLSPWAELAAPTRVRIEAVEPGNAQRRRDDVVTVTLRAAGIRENDAVTLFYSATGNPADDVALPMQSDDARYHWKTVLPPGSEGLKQDLFYYIQAGDAATEPYRIRVMATPVINVRTVTFNYPAYTGLPPRTVQRQGDVKALEGTRVVLTAEANQPIQSAHVAFDKARTKDVELQADGMTATGGFDLALLKDRVTPAHTSYLIRFSNIDGEENPKPTEYKIEVTADQPPEVRVVEPNTPVEKELSLPLGGLLRVTAAARDPDFQLGELTVVLKKAGVLLREERLLNEPRYGEFSNTLVLDAESYNLRVGDKFTFRVRAADNKTPNPNVVETKDYTVVVTPPTGQPQPQDQPRNPQQQPQDQNANPQNQNQRPQNGNNGANQPNGEQRPGDQQGQPGDQNNPPPPNGGNNQRPQQQPGGKDNGNPGGGNQNGQPQPNNGAPNNNQPQNNGQTQNGEQRPSGEQNQPGNQPQNGSQEGGNQPNRQPQGGDQQQPGAGNDQKSGSDQKQPEQPIDPNVDPGKAFDELQKHFEQKDKQSGQGQSGDQQQPKNGGQRDQQPQGEEKPNNEQKQTGEQNGGSQPQPREQKQDGSGQQQNSADGQQNSGGQSGGGQPQQSPDGGTPGDERKSGGKEGTGRSQSDAPPGDQQGAGGAQNQPSQKPGDPNAKPGGENGARTPDQQPGNNAERRPGENSGGREEKRPADGSNPNDDKPEQRPGDSQQGRPQERNAQGSGEQPGTTPDQRTGNAPQPGQNEQGKPNETPDGGQPRTGGKPNPGEPGVNREATPADSGQGSQSGGDPSKPDAKTPRPGEKPNEPQPGSQPSVNERNPQGTQSPNAGREGQAPADGGAPKPEEVAKPRNSQKGQDAASNQQEGNKEEGKTPSHSKTESDAQGESDNGDRSAKKGEEGGGQRSQQSGTGAAGQNQAGEQGGGVAGQEGDAATSNQAGDKVRSGDPTQGKPGEKPGPGTKTQQPGDQPGGEPSAQPGQPNSSGNEGRPADDRQQNASPDNPSGGQNQSGGGNVPDGTAGGDDRTPPNRNTVAPPADPANLEYAQKVTDLTLERLQQQLDQGRVDPELLKRFKSREALEEFARRWEAMRQNAKQPGPAGDTARKQFQDNLQSLGLQPRTTQQQGSSAAGDDFRDVRGRTRSAPPAKYADQYRAYQTGVGQAEK